jgi:poly(hydroxyalkanoate) depolymerase family esterase
MKQPDGVIAGTCSVPQGSRNYTLHLPKTRRNDFLVVMLHGCTQRAGELALATRMNERAAERGWPVLWPEQTMRANLMRCWNWFATRNQKRDGAEPVILSAMVRQVCGELAIPEGNVLLAGVSAGAGMAGVLAATHPEQIAALAMHSGVPYAAAQGVIGGFTLMKKGISDPVESGRRVFEAMAERAHVIPAFVIHGGKDPSVNPINGTRLAQQWAIANLLALGETDRLDGSIEPARQAVLAEPGRLEAVVANYEAAQGRLIAREWRVPALGHAWSGGSSAARFTDERGPDATNAILDFFGECATEVS